MTNKSLSISLLLIPTEVIYNMAGDATAKRYIFVAPLHCSWEGSQKSHCAIFLLKIAGGSKEEYVRTWFPKLLSLNPEE